MTVPNVTVFETAANGAGNLNPTPGNGLTALTSRDKPLTISTANGAVAIAYVDAASNAVVIAYQGTETQAQLLADLEMCLDAPAVALTDAVKFVPTVMLAVAAAGLSTDTVFVTGYSLGGDLAEYVAMRTGLAGMSFAGSGLPNYKPPAKVPQNFISWVEQGDPWANRGSDTALAALAPGQGHYGRVEIIGNATYKALTSAILADVAALEPALFEGKESSAIQALVAEYNKAFTARHVDNPYYSDINLLPIADTTLLA